MKRLLRFVLELFVEVFLLPLALLAALMLPWAMEYFKIP